jgi:hypothetical protein
VTCDNGDTVTFPKNLPQGIAYVTKPDGKTVLGLPEISEGNIFKPLGGSAVHDFNLCLLRNTLACTWVSKPANSKEEAALFQGSAVTAVMTALQAFKPTDEIEGMLAAQAVAMHHGAMECFRRAMLPEQGADVASRLRRDGANMARGMTEMLDALDRKRGKAPQVVRVERVVVQDGGRAIVGTVQAGGGGQ